MPFKSKAQQGYLFKHHPKIARKYAAHTSKSQYKRMPKRVKR
jgi:hypothetical protein